MTERHRHRHHLFDILSMATGWLLWGMLDRLKPFSDVAEAFGMFTHTPIKRALVYHEHTAAASISFQMINYQFKSNKSVTQGLSHFAGGYLLSLTL